MKTRRLMLTGSSALILALAAGSCSKMKEWTMPPKGKVFHVATDGSDENPGTRAKPFATLERARDAIRALKRKGGLPEGGVTVELHGGTYERREPFVLARADSGTEAAPIVYRARRSEEVRLVGGKVVTGWKPVTDKAILERLEPKARGKVLQADLKAFGVRDLGGVNSDRLELFFNDRPMTLARWPNEGFIKIVGLVEPGTVNVRGTKGSKTGKFMYKGDRPKRWVGEKDAWVHGYWFWDWSDQRHPVASIDTKKRILAVKPPYHGYGYRVGQWFYALNLLSEIDQPGEWYLDREAGILYFWPPAPIEKGRPMVSVLETLATMKDVSHVTIRGMTLEGVRGTAITITGGTKNQIAGCTLRNLGSWAVKVSGGTASGVVGCDICETGEGGIALGGGDRKTLTPANHYAENNHIHHYSRWNRMYKPAIHLSGVGLRAAHNLIHNAPHMAIGFGGNDHVIEFNEIHSVCYESNDAGAIYTGRNWTMRGTVIRHNYMHHVSGFRGRGCVGVYLDDMFCGTKIYGNVFYRVTRAAFIGGGRDCTVENNIFVDCRPALHIDARALGWAKYHTQGWVSEAREKGTHLGIAYKKPPYSTRYPKLVNILDDEPFAPKGNLVARNICVGGRWDGVHGRARPYVTFKDNLIDEDPHLVAPLPEAVPRLARPAVPVKSFQLRDDSPAFKLGFKPIPLEKIGLYQDERRASWPVEHTVRPMPEPPKPKRRVRRGPPPVFKVARLKAPVAVDGEIKKGEWPGRAMVIEQGIQGDKIRPRSLAWLAADDTHLFVAIDNAVDPSKPLRKGQVWGRDDAVEIALRNPATGKKASILVLRGYTNSHFESSTEAGAPPKVARKAGQGVRYAAKVVGKDRWTAEWRIPFASLGIDPRKHRKLQFNLTVRKTAAPIWLMWQGTGGYSWLVENAGFIMLPR